MLKKKEKVEPKQADDPQVVRLQNLTQRQVDMVVEVLRALLPPTEQDITIWSVTKTVDVIIYRTTIPGCSITIIDKGNRYFQISVYVGSDLLLTASFYPSVHANDTERAGWEITVKLIEAILRRPDRLEESFQGILASIQQLSKEANDGTNSGSSADSV